jgi:hypothetical protein
MKKFAAIVITAILLTVCSLCGAKDFHPLVPGMAAGIGALRRDARVEGGAFEVGCSLRWISP